MYAYVSKSPTTKDAWNGICKAFSDSGSDLNVFALEKFVTIKTDQFKTLEEYVNKKMKLWRRVRAAGYNIDEKTVGSLMLAGLPEVCRPMIIGIKNSGVTITVDFVKNSLLQDVLLNRDARKSESVLVAKSKSKKKHR